MPGDCCGAAATGGSITVRMYDLNGEGDCFLLTFRAGDGSERYVLIDCGIFTGTTGGAKRLRRVAKDVMEATGNHLHAVVITHEHWDHIVGFKYAMKTFFSEDTKIDELWMGWTENVDGDDLARLLNDKYEPTLQALELVTRLPELRDRFDAHSVRGVIAYRSPIALGAGLSMKTTEIMDKIHLELTSNVRYFSPEDPPLSLTEYPGVRFYTMGPPRDEDQLKVLEASGVAVDDIMLHDEAAYFNIAAFTAFGEDELDPELYGRYMRLHKRSRPFGEELGLTAKEAEEHMIGGELFFEEHYGFDEDDPEKEWRRIDYEWLASAEQLALYMDDYVNNTSLALAVELTSTGKVLLFPGDAQHGNWASWGERPWTVDDGNGETREIKGIDLIKKTVFYKTGHHGSHNGTLKEYLREMSNELVAMIPCDQKWAWDKHKWRHPDPGLLPEIETKTRGRIIRSDTHAPATKPDALTLSEWQEFMDNVEEGPGGLWVQYTVHDR
jgi:beta-lactamase superfamily II metal-dependent hydrolase